MDGSYRQQATRSNRACYIFLIDQSGSMGEVWDSDRLTKAEVLAREINNTLRMLIDRCTKDDPRPWYYYDLALISYRTRGPRDGTPLVGSGFQGRLAGRDLVSILDVFDNPLAESTRDPDDWLWYKPVICGGTPMTAALRYCHPIAEAWCRHNPASFPPVVIHITDGESTDGDPEEAAEQLRALRTDDGNLLLFTCHLSTVSTAHVMFPVTEHELPDVHGRRLFNMSSLLPDALLSLAQARKLPVKSGSRGMTFNAQGEALAQFIQTGTISGPLR